MESGEELQQLATSLIAKGMAPKTVSSLVEAVENQLNGD
jgi:hypothetical protein